MAATLMGWKPSQGEDELVDLPLNPEQVPVRPFEPLQTIIHPSSSIDQNSSPLSFATSTHEQVFMHTFADSPSATSSSNESLLYPSSRDSPFVCSSAPSSDRRMHRNRMRDPEWVPRPRNAFIIFRCQYSREHSNSQVNSSGNRVPNSHTEKTLSKRAAEAWKHLTPDEREHFKQLAEEEKEEHARLHPHYRFRPMRRRSSGRRKHRQTASDIVGGQSSQNWESKSPSPEPSYSRSSSQTTEPSAVIRKRRSFSVPLPGDVSVPYSYPSATSMSSPIAGRPGLKLKRSMSEMSRPAPPLYSWQYPSQSQMSFLDDSPFSSLDDFSRSPDMSPLPELAPFFNGCSFEAENLQPSAMPYTNIMPDLLTSDPSALKNVEMTSTPIPSQLLAPTRKNSSPPSLPLFAAVGSSLARWNDFSEPPGDSSAYSPSQAVEPTITPKDSISAIEQMSRPIEQMSPSSAIFLTSRNGGGREEGREQGMENTLGSTSYTHHPIASTSSSLLPDTPSLMTENTGPYDELDQDNALQAYAMGLTNLGLAYDYSLPSSTTNFATYDTGPPPDLEFDFSELFARAL